jgi:hypothetical protein
MGMASCDKQVDAYRCVTLKADNGNRYIRCRNSKTKHTFNSDFSLIGKCIRNQERECEFIMTDLEEFEILKKAQEANCASK